MGRADRARPEFVVGPECRVPKVSSEGPFPSATPGMPGGKGGSDQINSGSDQRDLI